MSLYDIDMISASEGWIVGARGRILHYLNGKWIEAVSPLASLVQQDQRRGIYPLALTCVHILGIDSGWSAGSEGTLLTYQNGQWISFPSPTKEPLADIQMLSARAGWVVGGSSYHGCILHCSDGEWTIVDSGMYPLPALTSISMVAPNDGWIVGAHVWPTAEDKRGGIQSSILHYQKGRWQKVFNPVPEERINAIHMLSSTTGWGVTGHGTVLHYSDGKWRIIERFPEAVWVALQMVSENEGWAVDARQGSIVHSHNGIWTLDHSPTNEPLHGVSMLSPYEGWAVGGSEGNKQGTILHYHNGEWQIYPWQAEQRESRQPRRWWRP